jgi:hypothetical protein
MVWILVKEAKLPLLAAVMAGFGGVISEVGASIMVGGNIKGYSRVLTTATVMETGRGNFDVAIALSIILLLLAYLSTWCSLKCSSGRRMTFPFRFEARTFRSSGEVPDPEFHPCSLRGNPCLIGPNGASKSAFFKPCPPWQNLLEEFLGAEDRRGYSSAISKKVCHGPPGTSAFDTTV